MVGTAPAVCNAGERLSSPALHAHSDALSYTGIVASCTKHGLRTGVKRVDGSAVLHKRNGVLALPAARRLPQRQHMRGGLEQELLIREWCDTVA